MILTSFSDLLDMSQKLKQLHAFLLIGVSCCCNYPKESCFCHHRNQTFIVDIISFTHCHLYALSPLSIDIIVFLYVELVLFLLPLFSHLPSIYTRKGNERRMRKVQSAQNIKLPVLLFAHFRGILCTCQEKTQEVESKQNLNIFKAGIISLSLVYRYIHIER